MTEWNNRAFRDEMRQEKVGGVKGTRERIAYYLNH